LPWAAVLQYFAEPAYPELLPAWLPDYQPPYTLCIEYDKVLVRQEWTPATGWRVKVRKGAREFINFLSQYYEVVVFTHSTFMVCGVVDDGRMGTWWAAWSTR
jgi:import inner membrane translocase subunit TIM50